jgi:hypothetical protein
MSDVTVKAKLDFDVDQKGLKENWYVLLSFKDNRFSPDSFLYMPPQSTREDAKEFSINLLKDAIKQIEEMT